MTSFLPSRPAMWPTLPTRIGLSLIAGLLAMTLLVSCKAPGQSEESPRRTAPASRQSNCDAKHQHCSSPARDSKAQRVKELEKRLRIKELEKGLRRLQSLPSEKPQAKRRPARRPRNRLNL